MKRLTRATVRKLYREGLLQAFGCGDKELDNHLVQALKNDIHIAGNAPGQWVSPDGVLEIYCENGIPNATDINDFSCYAAEAGCDPSEMVSYNCEKWFAVDKYVNLGIKGLGFSEKIFHEPHNSAVVAVHWE